MRYIPRVLLLVTVSLALVGCQAAAPAANPGEDVGGVQVHQGGESVTSNTGTVGTVIVRGDLPDELQEFPVPPGFALTSDGVGSAKTGNGILATATWVGSPSVADAADFYARTLAVGGWTQSLALESDSGRVLTFARDDHSALLRIDRDGPTTRVALLYGSGVPTDGPGAQNHLMCSGTEPIASMLR